MLIYFAGHASLKLVEELVLCTYDTEDIEIHGKPEVRADTGLRLYEWLDLIHRYLYTSTMQVLVILDCCNSGKAKEWTPREIGSRGDPQAATPDDLLCEHARKDRSFEILASCEVHEAAKEDKRRGGGGGFFTRLLVRHLEQNQKYLYVRDLPTRINIDLATELEGEIELQHCVYSRPIARSSGYYVFHYEEKEKAASVTPLRGQDDLAGHNTISNHNPTTLIPLYQAGRQLPLA